MNNDVGKINHGFKLPISKCKFQFKRLFLNVLAFFRLQPEI